MNTWNETHRRWLTGVDAVTGNSLTLCVEHIAVFRELRGNTTGIVMANGLEYEVEGRYEDVKGVVGLTREP